MLNAAVEIEPKKSRNSIRKNDVVEWLLFPERRNLNLNYVQTRRKPRTQIRIQLVRAYEKRLPEYLIKFGEQRLLAFYSDGK